MKTAESLKSKYLELFEEHNKAVRSAADKIHDTVIECIDQCKKTRASTTWYVWKLELKNIDGCEFSGRVWTKIQGYLRNPTTAYRSEIRMATVKTCFMW